LCIVDFVEGNTNSSMLLISNLVSQIYAISLGCHKIRITHNSKVETYNLNNQFKHLLSKLNPTHGQANARNVCFLIIGPTSEFSDY